MSFIKLKDGAGQAIRSYLEEKGIRHSIRIDLRSTGCCDSSLGLWVDDALPTDLAEERDDLTFVISPELHRLTGAVAVSYDPDRKGFIINSEKPISEWDGFGICNIGIDGKLQKQCGR